MSDDTQPLFLPGEAIDCERCGTTLYGSALDEAEATGMCPVCEEPYDDDPNWTDKADPADCDHEFVPGDDFCMGCGQEKPMWNEDVW